MKSLFRYLILAFAGVFLVSSAHAEAEKGSHKSSKEVKSSAAGCMQGSAFKYLDVNNVRTRINSGGDMWWDFEKGDYEIPKGSGKTSMFSASLWIGGTDQDNQLKLAAIRFRQGPDGGSPGSATDYFPGPLNTDDATIDAVTCSEWDKLFSITRKEVDDFLAWRQDRDSYPDYTIPKSITEWPAHGDLTKGQSYYIAPFYDEDGDLEYNPANGDFPYYDVKNELCKERILTMEEIEGGTMTNSILSDQVIKGDQTLWWVFNDMGNIHTETTGNPIGLEIRAQAFGFSTNDVINDMSFYSYEIVNRSTFPLFNTYFSQWVDTDLGYAEDDFVGCDVNRGLGYCYNGYEEDGNGQAWAYGINPPAIGVDFFQGPYIDADGSDNPAFVGNCDIVTPGYVDNNNGIDQMAINGVNFGDSIIDNERYGMRRFVYHINAASGPTSDPDYAQDYYNLLKGIWKDNSKMKYGGNGHSESGGTGPDCDFMFPGMSDICNWGTAGIDLGADKNWTEVTAGNAPDDRRFMQSAGPFTLESGAVNYITVGIPWARANDGGPNASVELLKLADDKCQNLFENCFQVINGPKAPDLTMREMDKEIVIYLSNRKFADKGNNFQGKYEEYDFNIVFDDTVASSDRGDSTYNFEGYQIFQVIDPTVSVADLYDVSKSRLAFQCDIKNDIGRIINYETDAELGALVPVERVNGENEGLKQSVKITKDFFSNETLVNNKQYYYIAVAYGYNEYHKYSDDPSAQIEGEMDLYGQQRPYLAGRGNIKAYTAIPHKNIGTVLNSAYGDGMALTRIEGKGNGDNFVDLQEESVEEILAKPARVEGVEFGHEDYPIAYNLKYKAGYSPISVEVVDPISLKEGDFRLAFDTLYPYLIENITETPGINGDTLTRNIGKWYIEDLATNERYYSDTTILVKNQQIFLDLGLGVNIGQVDKPGHAEIGEDEMNGDAPAMVDFNDNGGLLGGDVVYGNESNKWLSAVPDIDGSIVFDWIRSGSLLDHDHVYKSTSTFMDPSQNFENLLLDKGFVMCPAVLAQTRQEFPLLPLGIDDKSYNTLNKFEDINNIDLVFTSDKSKWTRCPVVEMALDTTYAENAAQLLHKRKGKSVNVNGETDVESDDPMLNSNYIDGVGMGWFPGYAIDVVTGERLNVVFGESSDLPEQNGRDMLWNPTDQLFQADTILAYGGKHAIWISREESYIKENPWGQDTTYHYRSGPYDAGFEANRMLSNETEKFILPNGVEMQDQRARPFWWFYGSCTWTTVPMLAEGTTLLDGDVTVKVRVNQPHARFSGSTAADSATIAASVNNYYPMYEFSTGDFVAQVADLEKGKSDLDLINVVPNPYYGYCEYEVNQLDNRVKITNLPKDCTVSIYSLEGTMLRQFKKDDVVSYIDWDLKNFAGIPISGGMYYIHVEAGELGERVVKFYAVMRPVDLNAF